VPSLNELAQRHTDLADDDVDWLHLLMSDWQLLADLSFGDLVLWLPTWNGSGYVAGAQMRPTTGPTVFTDDLVGSFLPKGRRPLLDLALAQRRLMRSNEQAALVPAEAIPVRRGDRVIAVIARHADPATARRSSRLEVSYLESFGELAAMVAEGSFPYPSGVAVLEGASPRVGDGLIRLDQDGIVVFASPNAVSAYRRLGLAADLVGARLSSVTAGLAPSRGPVDEELALVASGRAPRVSEVEGKGTNVLLRAIPLMRQGHRTGALVLVRDVSERRRRQRELLSKDATIREIHHRVKNNLQTVAALLRLQARRIEIPEGRAALEEAVRRVGSIAIVHETLSMTPDESVDFDEVADRVCAMVTELSSAEAAITPKRLGSFGELRAETATPLAMVLTELLQNAVEHGLRGGPGLLEVHALRHDDQLRVEVVDDGAGLPEGFDADVLGRLGLQIVRTLAVGELGGQLSFEEPDGGGTRVVLEIPHAS